MKNLMHIVMVLLVCFSGYGQQSYTFDYVMEYEIEHLTEKGSQKSSHYFFMSSTNSSYMMIVNEMGKEVGMTLVLKGGKYYYGTIEKDDFLVEAISLKCPGNGTLVQTEKVRDFELVTKSDTVIDTRSFSHVVLKPVNRRKTDNHEIFTKHYIMDNSLYLNFPSLPPDDIGYRFWEEKEKMPNGVLKECTVTDEKDKVITCTRLVQFIKLRKLIMVDRNCK